MSKKEKSIFSIWNPTYICMHVLFSKKQISVKELDLAYEA